jgi:hypothetical protein
MAKTKGVVLGAGYVRESRQHQGDGAGLSHHAVPRSDGQGPAHTEHRGSDTTRTTRHLPGDHNPLNAPDGARGASSMGLDDNQNRPTIDSPVPTHGRQMPDRGDTSKTEEVSQHGGSGVGTMPPRAGVLDDR